VSSHIDIYPRSECSVETTHSLDITDRTRLSLLYSAYNSRG